MKRTEMLLLVGVHESKAGHDQKKERRMYDREYLLKLRLPSTLGDSHKTMLPEKLHDYVENYTDTGTSSRTDMEVSEASPSFSLENESMKINNNKTIVTTPAHSKCDGNMQALIQQDDLYKAEPRQHIPKKAIVTTRADPKCDGNVSRAIPQDYLYKAEHGTTHQPQPHIQKKGSKVCSIYTTPNCMYCLCKMKTGTGSFIAENHHTGMHRDAEYPNETTDYPLSCARKQINIPRLHNSLCWILLLLQTSSCAGIILTPSKDNVHVAFENVSGVQIFTCSGNGTFVAWRVDGLDPTEQGAPNKGISVLPHMVSPDRRNVTAQLSVPTIKSNNNTSVVCTLLDTSYRNPQSAGPVTLLIQGILRPPDDLKIVSKDALRLSWIAPPSYEVDPPPAISHYVLSNNVSNWSKTINSSCAPSTPCNSSIGLGDPSLLMSHNTSILEYNGAIEFTLFAVSEAGNGNTTNYILQNTMRTLPEISSTTISTAANVVVNTTVTTSTAVHNNTIEVPIVIASILAIAVIAIIIIIIIIIIVIIKIKKYKKSIVTTPDDRECGIKTNEYIKTTFVTQQDDPYHVVVPWELQRLPHGHNDEPGTHQPQPHIETKIPSQYYNQPKLNIGIDTGDCAEYNFNDEITTSNTVKISEECQILESAEEATSTPPHVSQTKDVSKRIVVKGCQRKNEAIEGEYEYGAQSLTTENCGNTDSSSGSSDSVDSKSELIK